MVKTFEKYPFATIALLVLLMLIPNLDVLNVTIMEARNFITAREMVHDGNWLLTTMNGEPRYQKPPLPTWFTAIFGMTLGMKSVFALRFPTVIMILLTGIFTFLFSKRLLKDQTHSLVNALIAITSFYIIGIAIEAPWDIYTHTFMLMAIYYMFSDFEKQKTYSWNFLLCAFFIGLSFLSKGPISFYALLLPFLIAYGFVYKFDKQKVFYLISTLLIGLIIGLWWFLYVRVADPNSFLEIAKKETGNWSSYNIRPFYYYWSFFTQSGIWTIPAFMGLLYPYLKTRVTNIKAYKLSLLWTLFAVVLLSIIPEKKSRYLMPVLIPLAINTGFYIYYLFTHFKSISKKESIPAYFNFGLLGVIAIAFPVIAYFLVKGHFLDFWLQYSIASVVLFSIGLSLLINLFKRRIKAVFYLTIIFFASLLITGLPLSKVLYDNSNFKSISELHKETKFPVYSFNFYSPEMIWDFGDKIPEINNESKLENTFGLLTNSTIEEIRRRFNEHTIQYQTTYDLNTVSENKRNYKERLRADYYLLMASKPQFEVTE